MNGELQLLPSGNCMNFKWWCKVKHRYVGGGKWKSLFTHKSITTSNSMNDLHTCCSGSLWALLKMKKNTIFSACQILSRDCLTWEVNNLDCMQASTYIDNSFIWKLQKWIFKIWSGFFFCKEYQSQSHVERFNML